MGSETEQPGPTDVPPTGASVDARVKRLIEEVIDRREAGELVPESELIAAHPDLMPELAQQLQALRFVQRAYATARRAGPLETARGDAEPLPRIPGYELLYELSTGGQATVYRGTRTATGQDVAVKILPGGPFVTSKSRTRFEREADILAALDHPNIVGIVDRGRTPDGSFFLAMPFVEGVALDTFGATCRAGGDDRFPRRLLVAFEKVARAAHAAHVAGVVHRDLKPSNVIVDGRDEPHLLDFGLARLQTATPANPDAAGPAAAAGGMDWRRHTVTVSGQVIGSLPWSSPEQAAGHSAKVDPRADVYALGVCLYECLSGRLPLPVGEGVRETLDHICATPPAALGTARRRIVGVNVDAIEAVVMRALAKSPGRRQAGAGALADEIRAVLDGRPVAPAPPPLPYAPARRLPLRLRWVGAAVVVSALMVPVWYFWPQFQPAPKGVVVHRQPTTMNGFGMRLVQISPGKFRMGTDPIYESRGEWAEDERRRDVHVTRPFWISDTEITQGQYLNVTHRHPPGAPKDAPIDGGLPVTSITWDEAMEFCAELSAKEGKTYRLPTEAEWEYACRAGSTGGWAGDGKADAMAWHAGNAGGVLRSPDRTAWNHWGLYGMHGNAAEWCLDDYAPQYPDAAKDPLAKTDGALRAIRGGSFLTPPPQTRSAARDKLAPGSRRRDVGFRVVREDGPPSAATRHAP